MQTIKDKSVRTTLAVLSAVVLAACGGGGGGEDSSNGEGEARATVTGFSPTTATLGQATSFTVTGTNLPTTATLSWTGATCQAPTASSATGFTQVCTPSGTVGNQTVSVLTASGGAVLDTRTVAMINKLPHTGITANQCYTTIGADTLGLCSTATKNWFGLQDGDLANVNTMSYSQVGTYPITACVKDNVTGLIWEGKTASGVRAGNNLYTNYHSSYSGTQAQMDAATNTYGYVAAVNASVLCGYTDWRLPTADELHDIVDVSKPALGPTINATWFPNTPSNTTYWTSSPYVGSSFNAWYVGFSNGNVGYDYRSLSYYAVRLVRASQ